MKNSNIRLNSFQALSIMKEIVSYMNNSAEEIKNIKNQILNLEKNEIWNSQSSNVFTDKSVAIVNNFLLELEDTNNMIRGIMNQLNLYEEIDKKVLESLYGNMKI